jgi:hypothetical protein
LNSKTRGNVALGRAVAHFSRQGHFVFVPFGDNSGKIDLVISPDGVTMYRVQCKHASHVHTNILKKTGKTVYQLGLRGYIWNNEKGTGTRKRVYDKSSFDILFVSTPERDWLLDWPAICGATNPHRKTSGPPHGLVLGQRIAPFEWKPKHLAEAIAT